jgi:hypothetical protein
MGNKHAFVFVLLVGIAMATSPLSFDASIRQMRGDVMASHLSSTEKHVQLHNLDKIEEVCCNFNFLTCLMPTFKSTIASAHMHACTLQDMSSFSIDGSHNLMKAMEGRTSALKLSFEDAHAFSDSKPIAHLLDFERLLQSSSSSSLSSSASELSEFANIRPVCSSLSSLGQFFF